MLLLPCFLVTDALFFLPRGCPHTQKATSSQSQSHRGCKDREGCLTTMARLILSLFFFSHAKNEVKSENRRDMSTKPVAMLYPSLSILSIFAGNMLDFRTRKRTRSHTRTWVDPDSSSSFRRRRLSRSHNGESRKLCGSRRRRRAARRVFFLPRLRICIFPPFRSSSSQLASFC